jgi:hypothetical protein
MPTFFLSGCASDQMSLDRSYSSVRCLSSSSEKNGIVSFWSVPLVPTRPKYSESPLCSGAPCAPCSTAWSSSSEKGSGSTTLRWMLPAEARSYSCKTPRMRSAYSITCGARSRARLREK